MADRHSERSELDLDQIYESRLHVGKRHRGSKTETGLPPYSGPSTPEPRATPGHSAGPGEFDTPRVTPNTGTELPQVSEEHLASTHHRPANFQRGYSNESHTSRYSRASRHSRTSERHNSHRGRHDRRRSHDRQDHHRDHDHYDGHRRNHNRGRRDHDHHPERQHRDGHRDHHNGYRDHHNHNHNHHRRGEGYHHRENHYQAHYQNHDNRNYHKDGKREVRQYKLGEQVKIFSLKPGSHGKIAGKGAVATVIRRNKFNRYFVQFGNGIVWDRVHVSRMRPESWNDSHLKEEAAENATSVTFEDGGSPRKGEPSITSEVDTSKDGLSPKQGVSVDTSDQASSSAETHISVQESSKAVSPNPESSPSKPEGEDLCDEKSNDAEDIPEKLIHVPAGIYSTDQYTEIDLTETIKEEIVSNKFGSGMFDVSNNGSCTISKIVGSNSSGDRYANRALQKESSPGLAAKMQQNLDKSYRRLEAQVLKTLMWNEKANEGFLHDMASLVKQNQQDLRSHIKATEEQTQLHTENRKLRENNNLLIQKLKMLEREKRSDHSRINELKQTIHLLGTNSNFRASSTFVQNRRSTDPVIWNQTPEGTTPGARRGSKRNQVSQNRVIWQQ